ncbi:MAG TPA: hypothetical protein VGV13_09830 [Methylomirabilota bacterium]|nr:hypothetical protein [Methylomirabilota bacterium]
MDQTTRPKGIQVTFMARLKAGMKFDEQAKVWITYVPALQLYSQGSTKARAKRAIASAVRLFLTTAYEHGVWDKALRNVGLAPTGASQMPGPDSEFVGFFEEEILEKASFPEVFDVPAVLPLELIPA